jgi:hypothetical protein
MGARVLYLAHPVAPVRGGPSVAANTTNALYWLREIVLRTKGWAVCAPWIPYVQVLQDSGDPECPTRKRGMRDDLAILERCDVILLVGGRISSGMEAEVLHAAKFGIPWIDWSEHRSPATATVERLDQITDGFLERRKPQDYTLPLAMQDAGRFP